MPDNEMAKAYSPAEVEERWYDWWEARATSRPDRPRIREPYTIIMPPPNVTGVLHMGHALTNAVEDILMRWKRMSGYETLYLPGEDHAGIAGQYVVEKELAPRADAATTWAERDFLERAWDWMNRYRRKIRYQLAGWARRATGPASVSRWTPAPPAPCVPCSSTCTTRASSTRVSAS